MANLARAGERLGTNSFACVNQYSTWAEPVPPSFSLTLVSCETSVAMAADRSPVWPKGYVGSITHTDDLLGVAVARRKDFRSIGIDAEAIIQPETTVEIDELCMNERERSLRDSFEIDHQMFSSLCFSAKESFFKCLYPLTGVWFDFQDAEIAGFDANLQVLRMRFALPSCG